MAEEKLLSYRCDYEALREKLLAEPAQHAIPIGSVAFCMAKEDLIQIMDEDGNLTRHSRSEALAILDQRIALIDAALNPSEHEKPSEVECEEELRELTEPWSAEDERIFIQRGGRRIAHQPKIAVKEGTPTRPATAKKEYPVKSRVVERTKSEEAGEDPAESVLIKQVRESLFIRK